MTVATCSRLQNVSQAGKAFSCLFDSGSTTSWMNRHALPSNVTPTVTSKIKGQTIAGSFESKLQVEMTALKLPEFDKSQALAKVSMRLMNQPCRYDMIIGRDILKQFGVQLDFENEIMVMNEQIVAMRSFPTDLPPGEPTVAEQLLYECLEEDLDDNDELPISFEQDVFQTENEGYKSKTISKRQYEKVSIDDVVASCTHLNKNQQDDLRQLLNEYTTLFDGKLKAYTDETIHLELLPNSTPKRSRAYPVPRSQLEVFKHELLALIRDKVLERSGRSEWAAGTFIIPKKNGTVRWISDFRALNRCLRRKVYPLPRIGDILSRRTGYKFLSKLDISMQYYTFVLDEESRDLCTIITPFGIYRYCRLPMGVSQSPDIAQEIMERVLQEIEDIEIYLDDIACFSNSWEQHLTVLRKVLSRLQEKGFTINPAKCEWAVQETDFLGHWLTPTGIKPWQKKVDAMIKMQPPTTLKELRSYLGLVNYYRDMWPRRSHILQPLTDLTGTKKFQWDENCQKAFEQMRALVATDALLAYPDHNKPFHIETDASDYQLGAVIKQDNRPVAYYTRKLNSAQKNYTTIEKELLSIVETFKEFRTMLLGAELHVYTDHRNLTHELSQFTTQRVLRWRLLLEEYAPIFHYKEGPKNFIADALSRVPTSRIERQDTGSSKAFLSGTLNTEDTFDAQTCASIYSEQPELSDCLLMLPLSSLERNNYSEQPELSDCLLMLPLSSLERNNSLESKRPFSSLEDSDNDVFMTTPSFDNQMRLPFQLSTIEHYQQNDDHVKNLPTTKPEKYQLKEYGPYRLIVNTEQEQDRFAVPTPMLNPLIIWYHDVLQHTEGKERIFKSISQFFYHPQLRERINELLTRCVKCQQMKHDTTKLGNLAAKDLPLLPWEELHLDSIGPWTIKGLNKAEMSIRALTFIDPVTNFVEIARQKSLPNSEETRKLVERVWLCRYPRPSKIVTDNGPEFKFSFTRAMQQHGILHQPTSNRNPQANGIIERMHQTMGQVIRTFLDSQERPRSKEQIDELIEEALAVSLMATRCASHSSLDFLSPGALVFRRDMFLPIPIMIDILALHRKRQLQVDKRLLNENRHRRYHDYKVNEQVMKRRNDSNKTTPLFDGPYRILQVHTNGTVTLHLSDNKIERVNIRRLKPYRV